MGLVAHSNCFDVPGLIDELSPDATGVVDEIEVGANESALNNAEVIEVRGFPAGFKYPKLQEIAP